MLPVVGCWILALSSLALYAAVFAGATASRQSALALQTLLLAVFLLPPGVVYLLRFEQAFLVVSFFDYVLLALAMLLLPLALVRSVGARFEASGRTAFALACGCVLLASGLLAPSGLGAVSAVTVLAWLAAWRLPAAAMLFFCRACGVLSLGVAYGCIVMHPQQRLADWQAEDSNAAVALSQRHNVLVLMLDDVAAPAFFDMAWREWSPRLPGFTLYANALGAGPQAELAVAYTLSGRLPRADDVQGLYQLSRADSIFRDYHEAGFDTEIATPQGLEAFCGPFARCRQRPGRGMAALQALLAISWRHALSQQPLPAAPALQLAPLTMPQAAPAGELDRLIQRMHVGTQAPRMVFIHGRPRCETPGPVIEQGMQLLMIEHRCAGKAMADLADRLQSLGVYDQSMILVFSPRGVALPARRYALFSGIAGGMAPGNPSLSLHMPLLALKLPFHKAAATLENAPVSLLDVRATLCRDIAMCRRLLPLPGQDLGVAALTPARGRTLPDYVLAGGCVRQDCRISGKAIPVSSGWEELLPR